MNWRSPQLYPVPLQAVVDVYRPLSKSAGWNRIVCDLSLRGSQGNLTVAIMNRLEPGLIQIFGLRPDFSLGVRACSSLACSLLA